MTPPHLLNYCTYRPRLSSLSVNSRLIGFILLCFLSIFSPSGGVAQPVPLPLAERDLRIFLQQQKLVASDGIAGDVLGYSVALSADGTTALVGAEGDDVGGNADQGSAYVFTRSGDVWTQQTQLLATGGANGDSFGYSVALSADGNTALVGAFQDNVGANLDQGSAYVFTRSGDVWTQQAQLLADNGAGFDYFGSSVALSADGNTALVGATRDDVGGGDEGSVYVFTRSGGVWTQQTRLLADDGATDDLFGYLVALSADGTTALVGATDDDVGGNANQGSAYVFTRSGEVWTQQDQLVADDGAAGDAFARSVALSADGNTALVGAYTNDVGGNTDQGSAYVFTRNGITWTQQDQLLATDGAAQEHLGSSVALSADGNAALVGAYANDVGANVNQGSAYVFTRNGITWTQQDQLLADDGAAQDRFGNSAALSADGTTALVGAYADDIGAEVGQGSVYIFRNVFTTCSAGTTIPVSECNALVALYNGMAGDNWINNLNWLEHVDPCKWFGVTCTGGNVIGLNFYKNGLTGNIPASLGNLPELTGLNLAGNQLIGDIPANFSNLTSLQFGNTTVDYNLLTATDPAVIALLNTVNPSWDETQTIPPTNIAAVGDAVGLRVNWTPIPYQGDNGHYRVNCASATFDAETYTTNKTLSEIVISGLPAETYTCTVSTFTPAHGNNDNDLTSSGVSAAPVVYSGQDVPPNDLFNNPILFETYPYQNYSLNIENATREGDPLPPNNQACPVSLPLTAVGIHYEIPGDLDTDGVVMNVGGPIWYSNRRVIPREEGVADTAIVIYEENVDGDVGAIIACDDDNAPGEVSVSNVNFDLDPTKTYRAVVWNEGEATLGAIIEIAAASFDLVSPQDDSAALDAPTSFTWQAYANTFSYYFKIARTSDDPLSKYSLVELSPEADVDNLTCNTVLCTLTVVPGSILAEYLTDGNYLWSVGANMSATDTTLPLVNSNQIFRFIVGELPEVNLLTNGNFETDNDADKQPDGWTGSKLTSDKLKCNKPDKEVAYEGVCAYFFKGSADENAALTQNVDGSTLVSGQGLTLSVQVRGKGISSGTKIVVNVKYLNGGGTKEKIGFVLGNIEAYSFFSTLPVELLSTVSSVKVTIKSKRLAGKLFVDDLQLTTVPPAVSRAGHDPLPLPPTSGLTGSGQ